MIRMQTRPWPVIVACAAFLAFARAAEAGPPLVCHPLDAGDAALLPWGTGSGWHAPERSYDVANLRADVLRLLSADAPLLARMENLRRATVYAAERPAIAVELLEALLERAANGSSDWVAWFDAGYLIETYRQANVARLGDLLSGVDAPSTPYTELNELDGYNMLGAVLEWTGPNAEIELARSMMARDGALAREHWQRASALAASDTLVARNLATYSH